MTNTALQALIDRHGEAICAIILDNNRCIYIGYNTETSHLLSDITLETIGGVDFFHMKSQCHTQKPAANYISYYPTDTIQGVYTMDVGFEDDRIDPFILK